jgi:hypothetical protein
METENRGSRHRDAGALWSFGTRLLRPVGRGLMQAGVVTPGRTAVLGLALGQRADRRIVGLAGGHHGIDNPGDLVGHGHAGEIGVTTAFSAVAQRLVESS